MRDDVQRSEERAYGNAASVMQVSMLTVYICALVVSVLKLVDFVRQHGTGVSEPGAAWFLGWVVLAEVGLKLGSILVHKVVIDTPGSVSFKCVLKRVCWQSAVYLAVLGTVSKGVEILPLSVHLHLYVLQMMASFAAIVLAMVEWDNYQVSTETGGATLRV